jgi:DUF3102 family protein
MDIEPLNAEINPEQDTALAEHAGAIRELVKLTRENIVEIGRRLSEAHDHFAIAGVWMTWLDKEFAWSDQTARNFIHVYEFSCDPNSKHVLNLDLPLRVLYQIAAPKAEAAREEIAERIAAGEQVTRETVVAVVKRHRKPRAAVAKHDDADAADHTDKSAQARKAAYAAAEILDSEPRQPEAAETLIAHWQRCPAELGALLDAAGVDTNPFDKLAEIDPHDIARRILKPSALPRAA